MSYSEIDGQVVLTMSREDYDQIGRALNALAVLVAGQPGQESIETFNAVCDLGERLPSVEEVEGGRDLCECGDYRRSHKDGKGACAICSGSSAPYDGCVKFRLAMNHEL